MDTVIHRADTRGGGDHGWLRTRHSFSFADWYDPERMGFGTLRVLNDDTIAPDTGFGAHSHRDMEILTIVTHGAVTHKDSLGNTKSVPAGEVQTMSAGTGVTHAELNASLDEPLTLFQIWIEPKERGIEPRYAQKSFDLENQEPGIVLLASPNDADALPIHQDAYLSHAVLDAGHPARFTLRDPVHGVYAFVIEGTVMIGGETLGVRDGMGITGEKEIALASPGSARLLLIEVPMC